MEHATLEAVVHLQAAAAPAVNAAQRRAGTEHATLVAVVHLQAAAALAVNAALARAGMEHATPQAVTMQPTRRTHNDHDEL